MRILTYNIKQGLQTTDFDMSELSDAISSANADIICLQEVRQNSASHGSIDMLDQLKTNLGMDGYVFGLTWDSTLGNGIIYNGSLSSSENHILTTTDPVTSQTRGVLRCVIKNRGNTITVISTHLSGGDQTDPTAAGSVARAGQLDEVKTITNGLSGPVVIAGDFNHTSVAASYATADQYWRRTSAISAPPSIPANNTDRNHIYIQGGSLTCKFSFIIDNHSLTGGASDHQPVYADIGSYGLAGNSSIGGLFTE